MLSKLGAVDSAQATEYLTAMLNSYKLEAKDATGIIDKLIGLDNKYATSVSEIAEALKRSANTAQQSGVSFDQLASYITIVSSTTRRSAETIGESFKTMFARMETIKLGKYFEDETQSLNDVEKILAKDTINIKLRDETNSFRAMGDVIDDVGKKWNTLNETDQAAVANAIAGTRQKESFLALMSNYNKVLEAQTVIADSAGLAQDRYAIYLDGVEAAQNRLTASWENLWMQTVNSGIITFVLNLTSAVIDFTAAGGGLVPVLGLVLGGLIAIKGSDIGASLVSMVGGIKNMILSLTTMGETAVATGVAMDTAFGIVGIAIAAISIGVMYFKNKSQEAQKAAQDLAEEVNNLYAEVDKGQKQKSRLSDLGTEYEKLKGTVSRTTEEQQRYLEVQNKIHELLPQVAGNYDELGNYQIAEGVNLKKIIDLKNEEIKINQQLLDQKLADSMKAKLDLYKQEQTELERLIKRQQDWLSVNGQTGKNPTPLSDSQQKAKGLSDSEIATQKSKFDQVANDIKATFYSLSEEQQKVQLDILMGMGTFGEQLAKELSDGFEKVPVQEYTSLYEKHAAALDDVKEAYNGLTTTLSSVATQYKDIQGLLDKSSKGTLDFTDVQKISEIYPDYLKALSIEGNKLKINEDLLRKYAIAQAQKSVDTAKANDASQQEIDILQAQADAIGKNIPLSKEFVDVFTNLMAATSEKMSGSGKNVFDELSGSIANTNKEFKNGEISASQYFSILKQEMQNADFKTMFADNQNAADSFFTGLVTNAGSAMAQISSEMQSGKIGLVEYIDSLHQLEGVFQVIGNIVQSNGAEMGMSSEQILNVKSSTDELTSSIDGLVGMYDLVNVTIAGMSNNLQFGSDAYNSWVNTVANAMAAVGGLWTDASGNALNGASEIYKYGTAASGNMTVLANQIVVKVNGLIKKATHSVAEFLRSVAAGISTFKGTLNFIPKQTGEVPFHGGVSVLGQVIPIDFSLPSMSIEATADFKSASEGVNSLANQIESWGASSPVDLGDFIDPSGLGATTDALNGVSGAAGGVADSLNDAGQAADNLSNKLEHARKVAVDALKDQLKAYKALIDARKKLLQTMADEKKYERQLEEKQNNILKIQNEIAELQFDNSEEAQARMAELQDQLAKAQQDLEDTQYQHSIDQQIQALDAEYAEFEKRINDAIAAIMAIHATSLHGFAKKLAKILEALGDYTLPDSGDSGDSGDTATMHEGGIAGNTKLKDNEMFAKLMKGETVVTADQASNFMSRILPQLAEPISDGNGGGVNFEKMLEINVAGNLDKSVIPSLEDIVNKAIKKINDNMTSKGYTRRADMYQI